MHGSPVQAIAIQGPVYKLGYIVGCLGLGHRPLWPRSLSLGPSHYYNFYNTLIVRRAKAK